MSDTHRAPASVVDWRIAKRERHEHENDAVPGRSRNLPRLALRRSGSGGAASHL
jgi:hypothetical protein